MTLLAPDGTESPDFVDLYKRDHFILKTKDARANGSTDMLLLRAWGQASQYASNDPSGSLPAYLLVLDVGITMLAWDRRTGTHGAFASAKRIDLSALANRPDDSVQCPPFRETISGAHGALVQPDDARRLTVMPLVLQ